MSSKIQAILNDTNRHYSQPDRDHVETEGEEQSHIRRGFSGPFSLKYASSEFLQFLRVRWVFFPVNKLEEGLFIESLTRETRFEPPAVGISRTRC